MSETKIKIPDWLKVITGGKDMPDWVPPQSGKPPDSPESADKPRKERQHCWHLASDIADVHMCVQIVCCTCGMAHEQKLVRRPPPGHGYFTPERQRMVQGADNLPTGACQPPAFLREED